MDSLIDQSNSRTYEVRYRGETSASNVYRRALCPGSGRAELGLPEEKSPWSEEGDLLHWKDAHPDESRELLTHEQKAALNKNEALRDSFLKTQKIRCGIPPEEQPITIKEHEYFLSGFDGLPIDPPFPGHPDVIYYFPNRGILFIFDSKFGRIPVPAAENNMQLRSYALMAWDNFMGLKEIYAAITQPLCAAPDDIHVVRYEANTLVAAREDILAVLKATEASDAPRNPSLEACAYCKAKTACPEAREIVAILAQLQVRDMTPAQLQDYWKKAQTAIKVIEQMASRIKRLLSEFPEACPDLKLSDPSTDRRIKNTYMAFTKMFSDGLLGPDREQAIEKFLSCCSVSKPELESMVLKDMGVDKKAAFQMVQNSVGNYIEEHQKERHIIITKK